jgi:VIT1/CCC1 family predicted Fe2+/Mn2+ transporter
MKLAQGRVYGSVFASSADPATLSSTADGIVTILSALLAILPLVGVHISLTQDDITTLVAAGIAVFGGVMTIRGLILKVINTYGTQPTT